MGSYHVNKVERATLGAHDSGVSIFQNFLPISHSVIYLLFHYWFFGCFGSGLCCALVDIFPISPLITHITYLKVYLLTCLPITYFLLTDDRASLASHTLLTIHPIHDIYGSSTYMACRARRRWPPCAHAWCDLLHKFRF